MVFSFQDIHRIQAVGPLRLCYPLYIMEYSTRGHPCQLQMQQFENFLDGSALCTKNTPGYFLKLGNFTNASQNGSGTFSH